MADEAEADRLVEELVTKLGLSAVPVVDRLRAVDPFWAARGFRLLAERPDSERAGLAGLTRMFRDRCATSRCAALVEMVARLETPQLQLMAKELVRALQDEKLEIRQLACWGLARVPSAKAIPGLVLALQHEATPGPPTFAGYGWGSLAGDPTPGGLRTAAADALTELGPAARAVVPDLLLACEDSNPFVRLSAWTALARIDPTRFRAQANRHLLAALGDASAPAEFRGSAAARLGKVGGAGAADALVRALRDRGDDMIPGEEVACDAIVGLGELGAQAAGAVAELARYLDPNEIPACYQAWLGSTAAWALGKIGPDTPGARSALRRALKLPNPVVRREARRALGMDGHSGRR